MVCNSQQKTSTTMSTTRLTAATTTAVTASGLHDKIGDETNAPPIVHQEPHNTHLHVKGHGRNHTSKLQVKKGEKQLDLTASAMARKEHKVTANFGTEQRGVTGQRGWGRQDERTGKADGSTPESLFSSGVISASRYHEFLAELDG